MPKRDWIQTADAPPTLLPPAPSAYRVPAGEVVSAFSYWRWRLLISTYIGYATFYLLRKNLSTAFPAMEGVVLTAAQVGVIFTAHDISYGVSKFVAGLWADRYNPRVLLVGGTLVALLCNAMFGFGGVFSWLLFLWVANGLAQGFGFPPCARILAYWFAPRERGVYWGLFNTSHQVGLIAISLLASWLTTVFGWRYAFWVPAGIALGVALMLWKQVRDTPASVGLPDVETYHSLKDRAMSEGDYAAQEERAQVEPTAATVRKLSGSGLGAAHAPEPHEEEAPRPLGSEAPATDTTSIVSRYVWRNPSVWLVCIGNFFVYVVRTSILNWGPAYLNKIRGLSLVGAGSLTSMFELGGLLGCLLAGWITDRYFRGQRAPVCVGAMLLCALFIWLFWSTTSNNPAVYGAYYFGIGFAVYGPQFLVGVMMADLATKRAAGTAVGLSGLFGYASSLVSGALLGSVVTSYGWDSAFRIILASALIASVPFALCWNARPSVEEV